MNAYEKGSTIVKHVQWEQVSNKMHSKAMFSGETSDLYSEHKKLADNLPEDHAIVYADFSQN